MSTSASHRPEPGNHLLRENERLRRELETARRRLAELEPRILTSDTVSRPTSHAKDTGGSKADKRKEPDLKPFQIELLKLQKHLEIHSRRMIVLFEGRDASGKGGTIRRVTRYMNKKHYRVVALGKPTQDQKTQWYFQKYVAHFPRGGETVLFDRSWYNRAMVEPVFGFCTDEEYRNFMKGVVGFEKDLVRQGTILVKLYFSVSKAEQARRFERRRQDPLRRWKLSEIDVQAQDLWDEFSEKKYRMFSRTSTNRAPWTVIRSDRKPAARLNAIKMILNSVDYEDRDESLDFTPDPEVVVSAQDEIELLEEEWGPDLTNYDGPTS